MRRLKNGTPNVHPVGSIEIRALRRLKREQPESRYVFLTERLAPMTPAGFRKVHTVRYTELSPERLKSFWED